MDKPSQESGGLVRPGRKSLYTPFHWSLQATCYWRAATEQIIFPDVSQFQGWIPQLTCGDVCQRDSHGVTRRRGPWIGLSGGGDTGWAQITSLGAAWGVTAVSPYLGLWGRMTSNATQV